MIRWLIIVTVSVIVSLVSTCLLSETWQFGYVGSRYSIGLRKAYLWYAWRWVPIDDAFGFYADEGPAVNRLMYRMGSGARWRDVPLWPWASRLTLAFGYILLVIVALRIWRRPAPRRLTQALAVVAGTLVILWAASKFVTVEFSGSSVRFHIYDGTLAL